MRIMNVILHIPDDVAERFVAAGRNVSRLATEAVALEGYRNNILILSQVSEMLGLSRIESEDFLGQHNVPLSVTEV